MTQSNPLQTKEVNRGEASTRIAFWGAIIQAAILVLAFVGISLLVISSLRVDTATVQSATATAWFALVVFVSLAIVNVLSIVFTVRGRQAIGYGLTYFSLIAFLLGAILIVQGRALFLSTFLLLPAAIGIGWICPPRSRRFYTISTIVAFALAWAIEWINPPWRTVYAGTPVSSIVAIIFLFVFGALVLIQSRTVIASRLQLQFVVWTGTIIAVLSTIIITYSVVTLRQTAINDAQNEALSVSEARANEAANQLAPALNAARTLATTFKAVKDPRNSIQLSRYQANGILKQVAEENPNFLGTWTTWEPNAFDGLDAQYANTPLHDKTGRFIPYWVRNSSGKVEGVAIVDYETPGLNDWYNIPRVTKQEAILTPYFYPIDGVDVLLTSMAVPIVVNGRFYGAAGADLKIDFLQTIVDDINLYNGTAVGVLLTEDGTLIAVGNQPELALNPASSLFDDFEQLQPRIAEGEAFFTVSSDGKYLRAFAPIKAGEAGSDHWSFGLIVPLSEITAQATALATQQIIISLVLIALSLAALWYLTGQFTRPLLELTTVANSISAGDLNATAKMQSANELGILANTFNAMTSRLRETLQGLEQRVVERTRNLELASEVGRTVSQVQALDVMLRDACDLILKEFNLYYVQVYLTDPNQRNLILEAGTGDVGAQLLGRGHSLPLNIDSINGTAISPRVSGRSGFWRKVAL